MYTAVCKALIGKHMIHCNHNLKFPLQESKNSMRNTNQFTIHYSLLTKLMNTRKRYAAKIGYHFSAINRNIRKRNTFTRRSSQPLSTVLGDVTEQTKPKPLRHTPYQLTQQSLSMAANITIFISGWMVT